VVTIEKADFDNWPSRGQEDRPNIKGQYRQASRHDATSIENNLSICAQRMKIATTIRERIRLPT